MESKYPVAAARRRTTLPLSVDGLDALTTSTTASMDAVSKKDERRAIEIMGSYPAYPSDRLRLR